MIHFPAVVRRNQYTHTTSTSIFAMSLFLVLAVIFIASCGDEGDIVQDTTGPASDTTADTTGVTDAPVEGVTDMGVEEPIVEEPIDVEEPKVSFKGDIQPILAARCAIPGCHAAPGAAGLDLSQYATFKNGGNGGPAFITGNGKDSLVVKRIDGGGMPPIPPPLDADDVQLFIDWINEGAENN